MATTPEERSNQARNAADHRWSQAPDWSAATAPARKAFTERFYQQTDPALPEETRRKQAEKLRIIYYRELNRRSHAAKQRNAQVRVDGGDA